MYQCAHCGCETRQRRGGFRPISILFNLALVWILMVLGGGTLINTGHPVAMEAGKLMQTVTFVEPAIGWADDNATPLAHGLRVLQDGIPVGSDAS